MGYILIFINTFYEKKCRTYNYMLVVIILMFQFAIASMFAVILDYIEDSNRFTIGGRRGRHADWDVDRYRTYFQTKEDQDHLSALTAAAAVLGFVIGVTFTLTVLIWRLIEDIPESDPEVEEEVPQYPVIYNNR